MIDKGDKVYKSLKEMWVIYSYSKIDDICQKIFQKMWNRLCILSNSKKEIEDLMKIFKTENETPEVLKEYIHGDISDEQKKFFISGYFEATATNMFNYMVDIEKYKDEYKKDIKKIINVDIPDDNHIDEILERCGKISK